MGEFKGTPGPWEYIDASENARHKFAPVCIIRGSGRQVARFSWGKSSPYFPSEEESKSNARLIAAAPELLEALQEFVFLYEHDEGCRELTEYKRAKAAIAKALGNH